MTGDLERLDNVRPIIKFIFLENGRQLPMIKTKISKKIEFEVSKQKLSEAQANGARIIFVEAKRRFFLIYVVVDGKARPLRLEFEYAKVNQELDYVVVELRAAFPNIIFWRDFLKFDSDDYMILQLCF